MSWFLVRQDAHGTRFDVAQYVSESDADEAMASFEAGYPHHQTYYVEHRLTHTDVASCIDVVQDWFLKALTASMELPDGWFGRPFDNIHRLTWSAERGSKLFLELDAVMHLVISDPEIVACDPECLGLGCSQLVFDWTEYGSSGTRHATIYAEGGHIQFHDASIAR